MPTAAQERVDTSGVAVASPAAKALMTKLNVPPVGIGPVETSKFNGTDSAAFGGAEIPFPEPTLRRVPSAAITKTDTPNEASALSPGSALAMRMASPVAVNV